MHGPYNAFICANVRGLGVGVGVEVGARLGVNLTAEGLSVTEDVGLFFLLSLFIFLVAGFNDRTINNKINVRINGKISQLIFLSLLISLYYTVVYFTYKEVYPLVSLLA